MLEKLIVVRHGEVNKRYSLVDLGKQQMVSLATQIKPIIDGQNTLILSSPKSWVRQSATIIGEILGVVVEENKILISNLSHRENFPEALELVRSKEAGVRNIVLVTHKEYAEGLPAYYAWHELKTELSPQEVKRGEAMILYCLTRQLVHLQPKLDEV